MLLNKENFLYVQEYSFLCSIALLNKVFVQKYIFSSSKVLMNKENFALEKYYFVCSKEVVCSKVLLNKENFTFDQYLIQKNASML